MNTSSIPAAPRFDHELCFQSLCSTGRAYAFPCDARGHVDMSSLGGRARDDYLYARAVVGYELASPSVLLCHAH